MGGSFGKNNQKGAIVLTLEAPSAYGGEIISGKVHISLNEPFTEAFLYLKFKGQELTHWEEKRRVSETVGKKSRRKKIVVPHDGKALICKYAYCLNKWENMSKGGYLFPFTFRLPFGIPGSFRYSAGKTTASILYNFHAKLVARKPGKIKGLCPIHIKQEINAFKTNVNLQKNARLKTFCCLNKGLCTIDVVCPQDTYNPSQLAEIIVNLNLSNSKLPVKYIACKLSNSIRIKSSTGNVYFIKQTLLETSTARNLNSPNLLLDHNLKIELNLPSVKDKLESMYSTRGMLIDCIYNVEVKAIMDGFFMCCGDEPSVIHEIVIVPNMIVIPSAPEAPPDWNPQEYNVLNLEYDKRYDASVIP